MTRQEREGTAVNFRTTYRKHLQSLVCYVNEGLNLLFFFERSGLSINFDLNANIFLGGRKFLDENYGKI